MSRIISVRLLLPLILGSLCLMPERAPAREGETFNHFLSGYLFEVYMEGKLAPLYLIMTVSGRHTEGTGTEVQCTLAWLTSHAVDGAYRCELRHYSTAAGSITNLDIKEEALAFDLHVGGSDADKKLRISCTLEKTTGSYAVSASGLWSDQTHTEFTRVRWKQLESIELEHDTLLPALE